MRLVSIVSLVLLAAAVPGEAQDPDRMGRILDRVEREIREYQGRVRKEIRGLIREELEKARASAKAPKRPYLGIVVEEAAEGGLKIAETRGPAREAGLLKGDLLVELDGTPVTEGNIVELLDRRKPGDAVRATVLRNGGKETFEVRLGVHGD